MLRTIIYIHVYIILDFPITNRNASVLCQSECTCLHKTVNRAVFFVKSNGNTYPKGRALMQVYRVVPITKMRELTKVVYTFFSHLFLPDVFHGLVDLLLYMTHGSPSSG